MSNTSYCPNTPEDIREMLDVIGVASVDELFGAIPAALRTRSFYLPPGMSEYMSQTFPLGLSSVV